MSPESRSSPHPGTKITEAIVLAGGLGTRLREAVPTLPKCLAPVAGRPFLSYLIHFFAKQGISHFVFAVGYKKEQITAWLRTLPAGLHWQLSEEEEPLGTGGALKKACGLIRGRDALVLNGDTFFGIGLDDLAARHQAVEAECTLALKPMHDFTRYGVVELGEDQKVTSFREKQFYSSGLINGGVYALSRDRFLEKPLPEKFSFEKDYLEKAYTGGKIYGQVQDRYFIDIGIPEDLKKAQWELPQNFSLDDA